MEKAHPDVFNVLLQILDDGRITDSKGVTVDFKNTLLIMTSNLGSQFAFDKENQQENYMKEVKKYFKPEFINRIDEIVVFNALNDDMLGKIAHKFMNELSQRLKNKDIQLHVSDAVYYNIATQGVDPVFGARPMKRYIQRNIETLIAKKKYPYPAEIMLSHSFYLSHPKEFFDFYFNQMIYPDAQPNKAHHALSKLEKMGKLKGL